MRCYNFEYINFSSGLFKNIDMSYVIHLEGNGRLKSVKNELNKFKVTRKCCIVHNKGFKKCDKPNLLEQKTTYDLNDAYLTILKNAKEKNYNNILILEDDFFFDKKIRNHANEIDNFITNNDFDIYYLGAMPFLMRPIDFNFKHYKCIFGGAAHSIIYSKTIINYILKIENSIVTHPYGWDVILLKFIYTKKNKQIYIYYTPLCYQLFPVTENFKNWKLPEIFVYMMKLLKLDTKIDAYFLIYFLSKIGNYLFIYYYFLYYYIYYMIKKLELMQMK